MMQYLAITFIGTFLVLLLLLRTRLVGIALDQPNQRSLHSKVTPRTGGLAIMLGVLIAWCLMTQVWIWIALLLFLVMVSLVDDMRGLSVRWRLLAQLFVCTIFILVDMPNLAWWVLALLVLAMTWMVNLYNFMDGSDGLAGGMAVYGFGFYALAAYLTHDMQLALMSGSIASAALAFLLFNFHPARIFMGDAGSVPLGFLAGSIGLYGWQHSNWSLWFPILVFSPFIVDATVTLLKRLLRGEKVWQAHRSHYYQRLVQMGWGHRKTAITEYALMLAVGGSAVFLLTQPRPMVFFILILWVLVYAAILWMLDRLWAVHVRI